MLEEKPLRDQVVARMNSAREEVVRLSECAAKNSSMGAALDSGKKAEEWFFLRDILDVLDGDEVSR